MSRRTQRGFTLVEILIVVIILGILAAIVIPQFTSASTEARRSSVQSMAQTIRSQIQLYKLQHKDALPNITANWNVLTMYTNDTHGTSATKNNATGHIYGPYLQEIPRNQLVADANATLVDDATAAVVPDGSAGWQYDFTGGSGNFWGVNKKDDGTYELFKQ